MPDFVEIDFLGVETAKSGDAIAMRYSVNGVVRVHVVDGGYLETGKQIVDHVRQHFQTDKIDHVVLTHPDQDHANGLRQVLDDCDVGTLWMHRPWIYARELLPYFYTYTSERALESALRNAYSAVVELEELALDYGVDIQAPFQGRQIGAFWVMAPTPTRWAQCVLDSLKTPPTHDRPYKAQGGPRDATQSFSAAWGEEYFPPDNTSPDNEMSVIQYALLNQDKILLTGDAGREGLQEAINFAPSVGLHLPGINTFQVPHHGGRHNVSTQVLDQLLGPTLPTQPATWSWVAVCSSAKLDEAHPRKSVIRAMLHRGAHFTATEGRTVNVSRGISRGWTSIAQTPYPREQED